MEVFHEQVDFPDAPTTTEGYLALCTGMGKNQGHQQMYTKHILLCYRVTEDQLKAVTREAVDFLASDEQLLKGAQSNGNGPAWKTARAALSRWLRQGSSWNTAELFGEGNNVVPEAARKEAMQRIAQDAREEIKVNGLAHGIDPLIKQGFANGTPFFSRSTATSPARSAASIAASRMRDLDVSEYMPFIASIRSCNISFSRPDGMPIKRVTMKNALVPEAFDDRAKLMTSMDVDYQLLRNVAATVAATNKEDLLLSFNGDNIGNQHELEAAVNDFANGIRQSSNFDIVVSSANAELRGRKVNKSTRNLSPAKKVAPKAVSPRALDPIRTNKSDKEKAGGQKSGGGKLDGSNTGGKHTSGSKTGEVKTTGKKSDEAKLSESESGRSDSSTSAKAASQRRMRRAKKRTGSPKTSGPSRSPTPGQDPPVRYGKLPDPIDLSLDVDKDEDEVGDDENDQESRLLEYMQRKLEDLDAGFKAMRVRPEEWRSGSTTFGVTMKRLREQSTSIERYIPIDPALGFNPKFRAMAHQIVGADVIHDMNFGPKRGCVEQDYMGMGKTIQIIAAWVLNFILTFEANEGCTLPSNQRLRLDSEGLFKNRSPRVGATFLSAYSNGVEPWPRDWIKVMQNSPILIQAPQEWRPKMIILHDSGKKLCTSYGGEANGLYSSLTVQDLVEMLPRPDWDNNARPSYDFPSDLSDGVEGAKFTYQSNSSWADHPRATTSQPSPTSVRYFIVSTNKCWQSRVYDVVTENLKAVVEIDSEIRKVNPSHTAKLRSLRQRRRTTINKNMKGGGDGAQRNQAKRMAIWKDHKGDKKSVQMVCDLLYAAWVVIDEIHSAGGMNTITYANIIDPFNRIVKDPALRPSFTAITGSAMANGIVTVLVFALKALRRSDQAWKSLPEKAVQLLQKRDLNETLKVWRSFEKVTGKDIDRPIAERIENSPKMKDILEVIAEIIGTYFVGRDYQSVDAWGQKLSLMDCTLKDQYISVVYEETYHQMLKDVEQNILAQVKVLNDQALEEWRDIGGKLSGKPKPKPQSAKQVDPRSYQKAKILASFPNFLTAIYEYQDGHPETELLIGAETKWGDDLGKDNLQLDEILKNPTKILGSILYKAIDEICKGSTKMDHILQKAKSTARQTTTAPDPRKDQPNRPPVTYRSKYCVASNVRLCKAIMYAKLVKELGRDVIAWVGEGVDKDVEVLKWRKFYNTETEEVDDRVQFMVAGLKMVCQSIDLIEGHVFECLEPHGINAEAIQYGYRGYRIGQVVDEVEVNYLVHAGSYVEELTYGRNLVKNNFADQCRATQLNKIKELATTMAEEDEEV